MALGRIRVSKLGGVVFLLLGLLAAGAAALTVSRLMKKAGYTKGAVVRVVVAKHDVQPGVALTADDLKIVDWPEASKPAGAVSDPAELFVGGEGRVPISALFAGEPIVVERLANPNRGAGVAALVRKGYRAVAVKTDDAVARAGLVYPGAYVDVVATLRQGSGPPTTRIVIQRVRVLAVGSRTDVAGGVTRNKSDGMPSSTARGAVVTLEVTPQDVEILGMAQREGKVDLALRSASDDELSDTQGAVPTDFGKFPPRSTPPTKASSPSSKKRRRRR